MQIETISRVKDLAACQTGSEDDLIVKVVLPFFEILGYPSNSYELKFPFAAYRPNRRGRKPEADCVFFDKLPHTVDSSLLVVEVKKDDLSSAADQAFFYAGNLHAPFFVAWNKRAFELWQVHRFRSPELIGHYDLSTMTEKEILELRACLSPQRISEFCEKNEIKKFSFEDNLKEIESRYLARLSAELSCHKEFNLPQVRDLNQHYVELSLHEFEVVPLMEMEPFLKEGQHPEEMTGKRNKRPKLFHLPELVSRTPGLAVIGDPGAGKSTLLRHICLDNCYSDRLYVPLFIPIKEVVALNETIHSAILRVIRRFGDTDDPEHFFQTRLRAGRILLCLDGIDELDIDDPSGAREQITSLANQIADIAVRYPNNTVVVSARRESWPSCRSLIPQSFQEFLVAPLTRAASRTFVTKWFVDSPQNAEMVIDALRSRGWPAFASNPLLLTLTCACVPQLGRLPNKMTELIDRFLIVLVEHWSQIRRISMRDANVDLTSAATMKVLSRLGLSFHQRHRAAMNKADIVNQIAAHAKEAPQIFAEIAGQQGILRSWSIDEQYAFPHLSFQSCLTAKELRSRDDGPEILFEHRDDPFWIEAIKMYSEMGDVSDLAAKLIAAPRTMLESSLFVLADCLAAGGTIKQSELLDSALERLQAVAMSDNAFLSGKAFSALAHIPSAKELLAKQVRDESGKLNGKSEAAKHAVLILGPGIIDEVADSLVADGYSRDLLENFAHLPRSVAIEKLKALILRTHWQHQSARHVRRSAAGHMAEIGEDNAIGPLMELLDAPQLHEFEKQGLISALAQIDDPRIKPLLISIMNDSGQSGECRVEAAGLLARDVRAKKFLLKVIEDKTIDFFRRRDAAASLEKFGLTDDDLPSFRSLLFDPAPVFYGGPTCAASAVSAVKSEASHQMLEEALAFWQASENKFAPTIKKTVSQLLDLRDVRSDLRSQLMEAMDFEKGVINLELPDLAAEYFRRDRKSAEVLFIQAIDQYTRDEVYAGTLVWAVFTIIGRIPLSDDLLKAIIRLAQCNQESASIWKQLAAIWQRRDLTVDQRALLEESLSLTNPRKTFTEEIKQDIYADIEDTDDHVRHFLAELKAKAPGFTETIGSTAADEVDQLIRKAVDAVRKAAFAEAINICKTITQEELSSSRKNVVMRVLWEAADSKDVSDPLRLEAYNLLLKLSDSAERDATGSDQNVKVVAHTSYEKGVVLSRVERYQDAVAAFDVCIAVATGVHDAPRCYVVADAWFCKGQALGNAGLPEREMEAYQELRRRYGDSAAPHLRQLVARGLANMGMNLHRLERSDEAFEILGEVVSEFGKDENEGVYEPVAKALVHMGLILEEKDDREGAIKKYDEVRRRYCGLPVSAVRDPLGRALANKGIALEKLDRQKEALTAYNQMVRLFGDASDESLYPVLAEVFNRQGRLLGQLKRPEDAIIAFDNALNHFEPARCPDLIADTSLALANKGVALKHLGRDEDAMKCWDAVLERVKEFGADIVGEVAIKIAERGKAELIGEIAQE